MPTRRCGSVRTPPRRIVANVCISPRPSPSACCRTMRRRLYGLSGLKLLLPSILFMGFVRSALLALAGKEDEARAAMQRYLANDNAPIRTMSQWHARQSEKPLPSYNPLVLARLLIFEEEIRRWPPKSRTAGVINAVAHADEVIERAARCMSLMGPKPEVRTPTRHVRCTPDSRHRYADRSGPFRARGDIGPSTSSQGGCSLFPQGVQMDCMSAT